ncbi:MAG TPA: hypothetical protein VLT13_11270 [Bacteroidota bacterium]|nr:hypothetical protein [Bacteroidota bacterium]
MKTSLFVPLLVFASVLLFGCKKEDSITDPLASANVSTDDAADALASALGDGSATSGLTTQLEELASVAGGGALGKVDASASVLMDTVLTRSRTGTYSFNYTFRYSYGLVSANQFSFAYSMKGVYDTPKMSSDDSASAALQVSNLLSCQTYSVTGLYNRYGTQASKLRNKLTFRSTITAAITDLQIDKNTKRVTSGTATMTMYGQSSAGNAFSFTATVTFLGNQQGTLVINGKTYTLNLTLGEATAV